MYVNDMSTSLEYQWVMGDKFLSNYYTIFDMSKSSIGFVKPRRRPKLISHTDNIIKIKFKLIYLR